MRHHGCCGARESPPPTSKDSHSRPLLSAIPLLTGRPEAERSGERVNQLSWGLSASNHAALRNVSILWLSTGAEAKTEHSCDGAIL